MSGSNNAYHVDVLAIYKVERLYFLQPPLYNDIKIDEYGNHQVLPMPDFAKGNNAKG
jgi:hypothetical protein